MEAHEPVTATVTRGGKIHLPAEVMRSLDVKEGQQVVFYLKPGKALIQPIASVLAKPIW
jgi:bifunctional DNA-binding transcriptional regulator/antitoxin component of YhaV-PrlF toxin-antitoxin module